MPITSVSSSNAPTGPGPYSPAIRAGDLLFVSAQSAIHPQTHHFEPSTIETEARLAFENLKALVEAAGGTLRDVVRVGTYLSDPADYDGFNEIYEQYFTEEPLPSRTTVSVTHIWDSRQRIKVDCVAYLGD